ncbi:MAG: FAD-binding oxidoreductase [Proteobacteria bacterium]|nr:FAD-binding oxidoreductase [Pseudomonadota bacterium]
MKTQHADVAVVGAGIVGIACAYYLAISKRAPKVVIIDPLAPMSLTSAASGENYRNWWPHQVMTEFTDFSTDLMEEISRQSNNQLHMTRRGYALATRLADPDTLLRQLYEGYGADGGAKIRWHKKGSGTKYQPALSADWQSAPDGVDVIQDRAILDSYFPSFDKEVSTVLHIRRAGDISGQQMGSFMLHKIRELGGSVVQGKVVAIQRTGSFSVAVESEAAAQTITADLVVNAAGPYVGHVAELLGEKLPVQNVFQQKIAFEDAQKAINRQMPFSIDLDGQVVDWSEQEREVLAEDPDLDWLTKAMPGAIHCRPEGGEHGKWLKLGWAFNTTPSEPSETLPFFPNFPEIVLRGASRLNPSLKVYYGRLPARMSHYGGYYTMTKENWPLIGPMATSGAFVAGALSGFGTMASCATGALVAKWAFGDSRPEFTKFLCLYRYQDETLMKALLSSESTGIL